MPCSQLLCEALIYVGTLITVPMLILQYVLRWLLYLITPFMLALLMVPGKWVVVWRDSSALNGTELVINGIALDRAKNDTTGEFGMRDGSAGLLGDLIKSDDLQEIKLFASTFMSGFASGMQELRTQNTAFGDLIQVPKASGRNAALQGTADVLNAYARQIQEAVSRDGFFVRVPAGKQFYLYVTETIDVAKGTRGNVANAELWRKSPHEN